jgi:hypothetical protein
VLFDASGLLAVPRYLVFNNVMLPLLLVYYARRGYLLWNDPSAEDQLNLRRLRTEMSSSISSQ